MHPTNDLAGNVMEPSSIVLILAPILFPVAQKLGITELTVAVAPWLLSMIAFMLLITYVPEITLWLPNLLR